MIGKPYRREEKVWGHELWLANGPSYCSKVLVIEPGARTSIHFHRCKVETLFLAKGRLAVYLGGQKFIHDLADDAVDAPIYCMERGDVVTIQPYQRHGFHNVGEGRAVLFEAGTQHFDEDSFREALSDGPRTPR